MIEPRRKALVVGISGASSSGKTTLSKLLCEIFPNAIILHEDDFFRSDGDLPLKNGFSDGDCVESLMIPDIVTVLEYIKNNGTFPPEYKTTEDQHKVGERHVSDSTISELKAKVSVWTESGNAGQHILGSSPSAVTLCLFEGFLLFPLSMSAIHSYMDIKLFFQVSYAKAKARREARPPYVTSEGIWEEKPGYFDKIVWSNYVEEHQWMFELGDVDGKLKEESLQESGIEAQVDEGPDVDMETSLKWAVETLMKDLAKLVVE